MKKAVLASFLLAALPCLAQSTVGVDIASIHLPARSWDNDFNPGAYIKLANGITAGGYYNSLRRPSFYVGYTADWKMFSLTAGVITGYQRRDDRGFSNGYLTPMLAPSVRLPFEIFSITPRISYIPGLAGSSNVFHLSLEKTL